MTDHTNVVTKKGWGTVVGRLGRVELGHQEDVPVNKPIPELLCSSEGGQLRAISKESEH
jgi:hypothetical protein